MESQEKDKQKGEGSIKKKKVKINTSCGMARPIFCSVKTPPFLTPDMNVLGFLGRTGDERLVSESRLPPRNLPDLPTIEGKETIYHRVHFHLNPFCQKISSLEIEFQDRRLFSRGKGSNRKRLTAEFCPPLAQNGVAKDRKVCGLALGFLVRRSCV